MAILKGFATGTIIETDAHAEPIIDASAVPQIVNKDGEDVTNEPIPSTGVEGDVKE